MNGAELAPVIWLVGFVIVYSAFLFFLGYMYGRPVRRRRRPRHTSIRNIERSARQVHQELDGSTNRALRQMADVAARYGYERRDESSKLNQKIRKEV